MVEIRIDSDCSMDDGESLIYRSTQGGDTIIDNMATFIPSK